MEMVKRGARADKFFDYPEFHQVLDSTLFDLVVVMIGKNDINEDTRPAEFVGYMLSSHQALTEKGVTCVMCTKESRLYPPNHPHYVDRECHIEISMRVNEKYKNSL